MLVCVCELQFAHLLVPAWPCGAPCNSAGVWSKDLEASDSAAYEVMLDLLGLTGLQRVTARLLEGIEVQHVPGACCISRVPV